MEVAITKMSSKGQVVIPASMRTDLPEGEKILIIKEGGRIILKLLTDLEPALQDDILFAEKTELAFEEYRKGTFIRKKAGDFIDEISSW
ncbi:MAG: AbrB/MazE/SpoVT family DNA-binding domain-containing protein [Methanoregula sp.]|nr:AbrB/MazE/SpoVT family DNA-binding domain-containing protein [Methanoregula sp.]MDP2797913.1 AbrB/MazE/SpoVT family DNA-binding domain-containing protein [Methanoregula sp.]